MARYDENGNWTGPQFKEPKAPKKSKFGSKDKLPSKADTSTEMTDKVPRTPTQRNKVNRNFGRSVELNHAEILGGERVPMSGAIKNSPFNLEGDVRVRFPESKKVLALVESKGVTQIEMKGEKQFVVKTEWMKQAIAEAELQHAFGFVIVHPKGEGYMDDFVIIAMPTLVKMLDKLKEQEI